jgi:hypothetical protein
MREVVTRMTRIGRVLGSGRWRALRVGAAAVAAVGVVGAVPPAVASASPQKQALDWTEQAPATSPSARSEAVMAYDAATKTAVLFGGSANVYGGSLLGDTWTWNGTTWTEQHPATSPSARSDAVMAYDAATKTVVLFGGVSAADPNGLNDTWTWNGTTWTEQHPATSPPARYWATMAYDTATKTVVLFGGVNLADPSGLNDTWTWNGTTWTEQHPATSPPAQYVPSMASDAANGSVVLFNGIVTGISGDTNDTWTWNGTTWTEHHPVPGLTTRWSASMAYDAATATVVLFGGGTDSCLYDATWTWNGTTWTEQHPATSPSPRWQAVMAYDAATGTVALFGGETNTTGCKGPYRLLQQTWTWG